MTSEEPKKEPPDLPLRLLIAEDDPSDLDLTLRELKKSGLSLQIESVSTRSAFVEILNSKPIDIVLSDFRMDGWTGIDALTEIIKLDADIPLILVTGTLGDLKAVESIKLGVTDYVLKHHLARLPMAILRAQEGKSLRQAQKQSLEALRESEAHYRTLVENAPEAIVVLDIESGRFIDCNQNALSLFKLKRKALLMRGPVELSPPFQPDGRHSSVAAHLWTDYQSWKGASIFEWLHRDSLGVEIPCEVHLVQLPSSTRQLIRGSILNITERRRSADAVRDSEARYRAVVSNVMYGIYWASHDGILLDANPALVRMLGYDSLEALLAIRKTSALFCNLDAQDEVLGVGGPSDRVDCQADWKRLDGKIITVRLVGRRAHDTRLKTACIEVIVEEITERVALEKELRKAQKFEAIGRLAGGIAHDFNNMIGAILGWAELGMEETPSDSRFHRHFDKIRHQSIRAADLTRQMLAFARRQILAPVDIDLNVNVTETIGLMEKTFGSEIELKMNLAPHLPLIRADSSQLGQVIMNLCINARDAMPAGGTLLVETRQTSFNALQLAAEPQAKPGQYVILAITDTGNGMDPSTLEHLFEPFFTTKELGKGTGLGLATVYGIVRQHGGFLDVHSELQVGSVFRAYFPVASCSEAAAAPTESTEPLRGGSELILLVEDHEGLREIARETLTNLGYSVLTAGDGEEAVRQFDKNREDVDLLLFDVKLPKLSGLEAYAQIRDSAHEVPVIFVTGFSTETEMLQEVRRRGVTVLEKPYLSRELARHVRDTLDRHAVKLRPAD
jgi:two-component system, cell cycle sensor histidine kinase and response regulator CckA